LTILNRKNPQSFKSLMILFTFRHGETYPDVQMPLLPSHSEGIFH
jgi:hypothetical protein